VILEQNAHIGLADHQHAALILVERFTAVERDAVWEHAARAAADAAAQIRLLSGTDSAAAADTAWAASDTLHVAAAALGSRILAQAADAYDRAARTPHGRIPQPTPAGNQLRRAARLISASASLAKDPALAPLVLITRLGALVAHRGSLDHLGDLGHAWLYRNDRQIKAITYREDQADKASYTVSIRVLGG
jgi:hypothetical protein